MAIHTLPAGPRGSLLMGNLKAFERDPLGFLDRVAREYGDAAAYRMGPLQFIQVNHPDQIDQVLVKQARHFIKNISVRRGKVLLGEGLLTSEGEFWLRQRRLMAPAFHRERIAAYSREMVGCAEQSVASWRAGETREMLHEMSQLTMSIVTRSLFSTALGEGSTEIGRAVDACIKEWMALTFRPPFTDRWPLPGNLRFWRGIRRLEGLIYEIIRQRRLSGEEPGDLLSILLKAQDDDGSTMTDKQLRDELITLFGAGHETTAVTLTWIWYLLAQHPAVEERLGAELSQVLAGRAPTIEDLPRLRYAEQVVLEALRLYPAVWILAREALTDVDLGSLTVPKGSTVFVSPWVVHHDPRWFPDPLSFQPERWDGGLEKRLHTFAYFPFGGGPRICIGRQFAAMEAVLALATIAQRWRPRLVSDRPVGLEPLITLRPRGSTAMRLEPR